jgi:hypothetical protein
VPVAHLAAREVEARGISRMSRSTVNGEANVLLIFTAGAIASAGQVDWLWPARAFRFPPGCAASWFVTEGRFGSDGVKQPDGR